MKFFKFLKKDVWRVSVDDLSKKKAFGLRTLRIVLIVVQGFTKKQIQQGASSLTYYSLLTIVPIVAFFFGIARGFLLQGNFKKWLLDQFGGQQVVVKKLIFFSELSLKQTHKGVIAGISIVILLWAGIKMLMYIELSMNQIWEVRVARTLTRRFSDYMAMLFFCPLFVLLSTTLTVFLSATLTDLRSEVSLVKDLGPILFPILSLFPYVLTWLLFTFIYIFIPNTRVRFLPAFYASIFAGTVYQVIQWAYVYLQVGVSKYNAIYGTFAALPLFLVWVHLSWVILLLGAKLAFAFQNVNAYGFMAENIELSENMKQLFSLRIMHSCIKRFVQQKPLLSAVELSNQLSIPLPLMMSLIHQMKNAGLLSEVKAGVQRESVFQPAYPVDKLTIKQVLDMMNGQGEKVFVDKDAVYEKLTKNLEGFSKRIESSEHNELLKDF